MMPDVARGTSANSENPEKSENRLSEADFSTWLTKQQAADAIGVSTKTIESFAKDGKIQQAVWRPQNRGAAKAVYQPDDVARIASERKPGLQPFVLPAVHTPTNGNGNHTSDVSITHTRDVSPTGEEILRLVCAAALQTLTSEKPPTSENPSEKWWLTIEEAAARSGLSETNLRRRCQSGWPGAIKDGAWKIRRRDLEAL